MKKETGDLKYHSVNTLHCSGFIVECIVHKMPTLIMIINFLGFYLTFAIPVSFLTPLPAHAHQKHCCLLFIRMLNYVVYIGAEWRESVSKQDLVLFSFSANQPGFLLRGTTSPVIFSICLYYSNIKGREK